MDTHSRRGLKQFEHDETHGLRKLVDQMNRLHADMGGRDSRPERRALIQAMKAIENGIQQARAEQQAVWELEDQARRLQTHQACSRTPDAHGMG